MNPPLIVKYGKRNLATNKNFTVAETSEPPQVQIDPEGCYTLVMIDPDAGAGKGRETGLYFLHWLVVNISGGALERGKTIVSYFPPSPPSGKHTYIFQLYKQECSMMYNLNRPKELSNWSLPEFLQGKKLTLVSEVAMKSGQ